jgi:Zn-dependent protease
MSEQVPLDVPSLRARVERRFRVYDVQSDEHVVAFYVEVDKGSLEREFSELKAELKAQRLIPLLKYQGGEHAIYVLRNPHRVKRGARVNVILFLATVLTTTLAGAVTAFTYYNSGFDTTRVTEGEYLRQMFALENLGMGFLTFALPLMLILTVHEFGHYLLARRHGMEASLPYFIPVPPFIGLNIGTFGAFISIREPMPNRKALFDIGAAGPIAGFLVAVPVLLVGFALMAASPVHVPADDGNTIYIGQPLLYTFLSMPFGFADDVLTHPTAFAGWVGLFVTAINLLPAGQLDGGHVAAAMFGERARYASYAAVLALLGIGLAPLLGLPGYDGWLIFALLIGLLGVRHPPTLDGVSGLDGRRMVIGWMTFGMGLLCFTLIPVVG